MILQYDEKTKVAIHKDLKIKAQDLSLQDVKINAIQTELKTLVIENWFYGQTPPDPKHRKYFPKGSDLRNLKKTIFRLCEFTDSEIDSVRDVIEKLQGYDKY